MRQAERQWVIGCWVWTVALSLLLRIGGKGAAPGVASVLEGDSQHHDLGLVTEMSERRVGVRLRASHIV